MRALALLVLVACEGGSGGPLPPEIGGTCEVDSDCASNVCWDFSDYDPLCSGTVCSAECDVDQDCIDLATDAGAFSPEGASCGDDQRCDFVGTGIGSFACA